MRVTIGIVFTLLTGLFISVYSAKNKTVLHVVNPFMDILTDSKQYIGIILKPEDEDVYISKCLKNRKTLGRFKTTQEAYYAIIRNCGI